LAMRSHHFGDICVRQVAHVPDADPLPRNLKSPLATGTVYGLRLTYRQ
jgi:hypothetical protein